MITFAEEILNGELYFLYSDIVEINNARAIYTSEK